MGGHGHGKAPTAKEVGYRRYYWNMAAEGCRHLYHGCRLFGVNTRLAWQYSRRLGAGSVLTRRERVILQRATLDLLRLVPFSFFVIVPFAELLLPVCLKMYPNMIPSTFETQSQGENRAFANALRSLKARKRVLEYTTTQLVAMGSDHQDLLRAASCGDPVSGDMIRRVAPLFAENGPLALERLPADTIVALSRAIGTNAPRPLSLLPHRMTAPLHRSRIEKMYRKLHHDDVLLRMEGVAGLADLTRSELERACDQRGMRWADSTEALQEQLQTWTALATDPLVPYHALFFFKPTANSLERSMESLPLEHRKKLLRIHGTLPVNVQETLERLCEKVDTTAEASLPTETESADALARRVAKLSSDEKESTSDLDDQSVNAKIAEFLGSDDEGVARHHAALHAKHGKVTVTIVIEFLAKHTHCSSHIVSNLMDALEMGEGNAEMTPQMLQALAARCSESSTPAAAPPVEAQHARQPSEAPKYGANATAGAQGRPLGSDGGGKPDAAGSSWSNDPRVTTAPPDDKHFFLALGSLIAMFAGIGVLITVVGIPGHH